MSFNIEVEGGKTVRLATAGKYCDKDIVVTATGESVTYPKADEPQTLGQLACLARASQMREIRYTPVANIPSNGETAGTEYRGLCYSSVRDTDKFVGFNVSFETFMTAMQNPKSVIYTKGSAINNAGLWYGVNCSSFVSYALGLPYFHVTKTIDKVPGVVQVSLEDIQLCDFINQCDDEKLGGHTILITGITRDENGNIVTIETSESGGRGDRSGGQNTFTYADFVNDYFVNENYSVYRYTKLHESPYIANKFIPLENEPVATIVYSDLSTDLGNKATIRTDETITLQPLVTGGYTAIKLYKDGVEIGSYNVADITLKDLDAGKYTARLYPEKENGSVSFIVADVNAYREGNRYYFNGDSKPLRVIFKHAEYYTIHFVDLTEDDLARGYKDIAHDDDSAHFVCVPSKNEYGINVAQFLYNAKAITDYPYTLTASDLAASMMSPEGAPVKGDAIRIYTKGLLEIPSDGAVVSVTRQSGYRWVCYFYDENGMYIGKTDWQTASASNIMDVALNEGTRDGAKYFRISIGSSTGEDQIFTGREAEIAETVVITFAEYQEAQPYTLTSADMTVGAVNSDGSNASGNNRIYTTEPIDLSRGTVSISIPAPYNWIAYYSTKPYFNSTTLLGKTSFGGNNIDDVLNATLAQGTTEGAKYVRISLRDSTNTSANLTGRIDEFMNAVKITITP